MFKKFLLTLMIGLFLIPSLAKADGGLFYPPDYWVYETGQKAAIFYEKGVETLVLQASFSGNAKDFAWIVPTPSKPEVSKVSDDLFTNLSKLTQSEDEQTALMGRSGFLTTGEKSGVEVIEEKQVGIFEVKILSATDKDALYNWLKENGFTYPESKKYILDDYISNKWFFTIAKISAEALTPDVESKLREGTLSPLQLVFASENIVYPLKISAINEIGKSQSPIIMPSETNTGPQDGEKTSIMPKPDFNYTPIELYIFADHKKEISDFDIGYANWIKSDQIKKLAKDDKGNYWVNAKNKMFLTKLSRSMQTSEMTNDLFPDDAADNKKIGVLSYWQKIVIWSMNYSSLVLMISLAVFLVLSIFQFNSNYKKHRWCWIVQWLAFIFITFIYIVYLVNLIQPGTWIPIVSLTSDAIAYLSLPILLLLIMKLQKNRQKSF